MMVSLSTIAQVMQPNINESSSSASDFELAKYQLHDLENEGRITRTLWALAKFLIQIPLMYGIFTDIKKRAYVSLTSTLQTSEGLFLLDNDPK